MGGGGGKEAGWGHDSVKGPPGTGRRGAEEPNSAKVGTIFFTALHLASAVVKVQMRY